MDEEIPSSRSGLSANGSAGTNYMGASSLSNHNPAPKTLRVAVRLSEREQQDIRDASRTRGYAHPSAFIRAAIRNELAGRSEWTEAEQRMAAGLDRVAREIFRMGRGQQALFSLVDALTKTLLTCVPEPPLDARPQAIARGRERYERLLKTAGKWMAGEAETAMQELMDHDTRQ